MAVTSSDAGVVPSPLPEARSASPGPATLTSRALPMPTDETGVAGYEMRRLAVQIAARPLRTKVGLTIRAVDRDAAQVLARDHDYELHVRGAAEAGFLWVEFWPRG